MLEDGRLTDNKGRVVDFSNALLILTSNVGSRNILATAEARRAQGADAADEGGYRQMRAAVKAELGKAFRPEFLNRLDEVGAPPLPVACQGDRERDLPRFAGRRSMRGLACLPSTRPARCPSGSCAFPPLP